MPGELSLEDVLRVLERHPFLPRPDYIVILPHHVIMRTDVATYLVRGLTSFVGGRGVVLLTYDAGSDTVVHEVLHVAGFGEFGARVLTPILARFRSVVPPLVRRRDRYELCPDACGNVELARLGARVFVRVG